MPNERILNCLKRYIQRFWEYQINHIFDIFELISVITMLIVVVITNDDIPNVIFIPSIVAFSITAFALTVLRVRNLNKCWLKEKKYSDKQNILINDMLRCKSIVPKDLVMRIDKMQKISKTRRKNNEENNKKLNLIQLIINMIELFFQYAIIIFYIVNISWSNISLGSIMQITANLAILMSALGHINSLARNIDKNAHNINCMKAEEDDLARIMEVYKDENNLIESDKPIHYIILNPFKIQYEKNGAEKPFSLTLKNQVFFKEGDVIFFRGPSGSGKSTVMKILMNRVKVGKSIDIPNTRRFLLYDDSLKFGSLSIFDEFFVDSEVDLEKAYSLLNELNLVTELKLNSKETMEKWMKQSKYKEMSHGQQQRIILAKLLYHLDENIDMLILDEVTSGMDENVQDSIDAQKVMEFCVRYANSDKKRLVLVSTHQNFDTDVFESEGYKVKSYMFGDGLMQEM